MVEPEQNRTQTREEKEAAKDLFYDLTPIRPSSPPSKILIISIPRSGSTSLLHALGTYFDYSAVNEPFNPLNVSVPFVLEEKMVVKVIVGGPNPTFYDHFSSLDDYFVYLDKFRAKFDKTILLSRASADDAIQSYASAREREADLCATNPDIDAEARSRIWHGSYSDPPRTPDPSIKEEMLGFIETLATYAKRSGIPLILYEELYSKDIVQFSKALESLDLPVDCSALRSLLHPSRRYRQT